MARCTNVSRIINPADAGFSLWGARFSVYLFKLCFFPTQVAYWPVEVFFVEYFLGFLKRFLRGIGVHRYFDKADNSYIDAVCSWHGIVSLLCDAGHAVR